MHMVMCIKILFLCLALLATVSGVNSSRQLYVRSISDLTSVCPGEPCLTLDQYVENCDTYVTSNTEFLLLPGQHNLTHPFVARDVHNITIKAKKQDKIDVHYTQFPSNKTRAALHFINASRVTIKRVY